jgi:ring-1,2-phenylacetyl-CoA epoxidase subunit PaaE
MAKFHALKVKEVRRETPETVSVALEVPAELKAEYDYLHGQYLTFKFDSDGEEIRRSYSICTAPSENDLRVAIKQVPEGRFSTFANEVLSAGDVLETMTPMGNFNTPLVETNSKHYVAFAAGSGITPVMSILKSVLKKEPNSRFSLIYGNKNFSSIIFREEIEALKNHFLNRLSVYHVLSREDVGIDLNYGRITGEKCALYFDSVLRVDDVDEVFICGPFDMIMGVKKTLTDRGMDPKSIHFELFGTPDQQKKSAVAQTKKDILEEVTSEVTIVLDNNRFSFPLSSDGESVLETALNIGADLPFACKGGMCCTCKARLVEGKVDMDLNYALEEEELEQGFILTCQSHPKTAKVVIDFDDI